MKFFKYTLIIVAIFLVSALGFFLYSISTLPDPIVINNKLKNKEQLKTKTEPHNKISDETNELPQTNNDGFIPNKPSEIAQKKSNDTNTSEEINSLINEDYKDIRVCENLGKPSVEKINPDIMQKALTNGARNDSSVESFRLPLKHIFQSKPMKELFAELEEAGVDNLEGQERSNYLKKIGFYSFAAKKAYEIYNQKAEFEEIGDRAYHLYVISRIAQKKPELASDKTILDFCSQLQESIGEKSKTNIGEERRELLKLIDYAGLTPKELNFNPTIRTKFNLELDNKNIKFGLTHPGMDLN